MNAVITKVTITHFIIVYRLFIFCNSTDRILNHGKYKRVSQVISYDPPFSWPIYANNHFDGELNFGKGSCRTKYVLFHAKDDMNTLYKL